MRRPHIRLRYLGLRWRLAGWVTLVTLLCTGIAFVAVYRGTGTQLRHQIDREISGDAGEFAAQPRACGLALAQAGLRCGRRAMCATSPSARARRSCSRSCRAQRRARNRPELLGTRDRPTRERRQARAGTGEPPGSAAAHGAATATRRSSLPDVGDLRLLKRLVRLPGGLRVTVGGRRAPRPGRTRPARRRTHLHPRRHTRARRRSARVLSDRHPRVAAAAADGGGGRAGICGGSASAHP